MDAQRMHDLEMEKTQAKPVSKERLEASLKAKNGPSGEPRRPVPFDPIEAAMQQNPGLTRKKAEEMADEFGF